MSTVREVLEKLDKTAEVMVTLGEKVTNAVEKVGTKPEPPKVVEVRPAWEDNPWVPFTAAGLLLSPDARKVLGPKGVERMTRLLEAGGVKLEEKALDTTDLASVLPVGILSAIERELKDRAVGRKVFRVLRVQEKTGKIPYASATTASWLTEGAAPAAESEPSVGAISWGVNTLGAGVTVTYEALNDVNFVADLVRQSFADALAQAEDKAFLVGSGVGEPKGIYTTISANAIDGTNKGLDVLLEAWVALKAEYRQDAVWFMNENTLLNLLKQKNAQNVYYLAPNLAEGPTAGRLFGRPLYTNSNLADNVILVGSPSRYLILDKVSASNGAPEKGFIVTTEGKTLVSTRSVYIFTYERLDGQLIYNSLNPAIKTWIAIANFLQTI